MGQCGQGNSTGPITKPKKVIGLDGVAIQQISAGTSHSLAWTALPRDRSATATVTMNWSHHDDFLSGNIHVGLQARADVARPPEFVFQLLGSTSQRAVTTREKYWNCKTNTLILGFRVKVTVVGFIAVTQQSVSKNAPKSTNQNKYPDTGASSEVLPLSLGDEFRREALWFSLFVKYVIQGL